MPARGQPCQPAGDFFREASDRSARLGVSLGERQPPRPLGAASSLSLAERVRVRAGRRPLAPPVPLAQRKSPPLRRTGPLGAATGKQMPGRCPTEARATCRDNTQPGKVQCWSDLLASFPCSWFLGHFTPASLVPLLPAPASSSLVRSACQSASEVRSRDLPAHIVSSDGPRWRGRSAASTASTRKNPKKCGLRSNALRRWPRRAKAGPAARAAIRSTTTPLRRPTCDEIGRAAPCAARWRALKLDGFQEVAGPNRLASRNVAPRGVSRAPY